MRKMKDSGIEWIGEIPEGWEVVKAKYLFAQRNEKGNSALVLLSPTQKYGVIPQSQLEGVVQVKENTDLRTFKTIHIGDFVISLRSFQGGFEFSNYEGVCSPAYQVFHATKTSVYKGYKQDKIEMRGDRAEMSDFPLYLNTVAGGLDRRDQTIGGFSFVVKIYAVPVVEIIG